MKLCVDEDLASRELMARLERAGHLAFRLPPGSSDEAVWAEAQRQQAAVLTRNVVDFTLMAAAMPEHHGLLVVHVENDRARDMRFAEIAAAVGNVDARHPQGIAGRTLPLNAFR